MITMQAAGQLTPKVFYSERTVALHLIPKGGHPTAKTRLVELSREGAQGVENAQLLRMMAAAPEMFAGLQRDTSKAAAELVREIIG